MSRYIDEEVLLQKLSRMIDFCEKHKVSGLTALFQVGDAIMDCPTADVVEVRHGYWTFKNTTYCHYGCFCSVCGKKSGIGGIRENQLKPYCPNCGAKMDGERSENGKGTDN